MAEHDPSNNLMEQYEFIPEHLRHHFYRDVFRDADDEEHHDEIRNARRTRSAYLVTQLQASPVAQQGSKTLVSTLYSLGVERALTTQMTFERTLERLGNYFHQLSRDLEMLEQAEPVAVPSWLYTRSTPGSLPTLTQIQRKIVNSVEECLHESDIYLAMYEQLPSPPAASLTPLLRYAACSKRSNMLNQYLACPKLPLRDSNQTEAIQQQQRPASLLALDLMRPVIIDDILNCVADEVHAFSPQAVTGPFACYPLLSYSGQVAIGVLALDSCRNALKMRPESMNPEALSAFLTRMKLKEAAIELKRHQMNGQQFLALTENDLNHKPVFHKFKVSTRKKLLELIHALQQGKMVHLASPPRYFIHDPAAMDFVQQVASISGVFIDGFRAVHWHRAMANVTRDQACTAYDVYDILLRGIALSLINVDRVALWKIDTTEKAIDTVASTQVPDDRLLPFLNWSDRQIKRLVLYKENPDAHGRLMQGSIGKISFKALPSAGAMQGVKGIGNSVLCEQASYHISWANRSFDVLPWAKLRQLLPIRRMNSKHFQLRNLIEIIEKHTKNNSPTSVIAVAEPNGVALIVNDPKRPDEIQYVLVVDFESNYKIPYSVNAFLMRAVQITEKSLLSVRGRESRALYRQNSTKRTTKTYNSLGIAPSAEALRGLDGIVSNVFYEITENLPGVQLQISELQPDGTQLRYTFTANGSSLFGNILIRGQGLSYSCLDAKVPLVVGKESTLRQRLRHFESGRHEGNEIESEEFPFVFVPLMHEDCAVGVLTVNRFVNVPKARNDEEHPESGVVDYLTSLAKVLASAIYFKRRSFALYQLQSIGLNPIRSPQQIFFHGCRLLKDVMVGAWKVRVVEVDFARGQTTLLYDLSEAERVNEHSELTEMILPLQFRFNELLADTIGAHFSIGEQNATELMRSVLQSVQDDEQEQRATEEISLNDLKPSDQKRRIESQTKRKYFTLTLSSLEEQQLSVAHSKSPRHQNGTISLSKRMSNEKYTSHALMMFLASKTYLYAPVPSLEGKSSSVYITATNLPQFHANCEQNYLQRVADCVSKLVDDLYRCVERSRARVSALEAFRRTCEQTLDESLAILDLEQISAVQLANVTKVSHILAPDQELRLEGLISLQQTAIIAIEGILNGPTTYFALLEPSLNLLRFTSASRTSVMKSKHLRKGYGVSFQVLESQVPIVVTRENAVEAQSTPVDIPLESGNYFRHLRIFAADPARLKWPFICVPLGTSGVLSIQNLEKYGRLACENQPEIGLVDFLRQIATAFANTLAVVRQQSLKFRQRLRHNALMRVLACRDDLKGPPAPKYIQQVVIQQIELALNGVDAYIGLVEPLCEQIQFQTASIHSRMQGQVVNTVDSATFGVFVTQRPLVIPQMEHYHEKYDHKSEIDHDNAANHHKLRLLGASSMHGPFVCVPIPFVGVLSVDTFPGAAGGIYSRQFPEYGVLDWLTAMANHLGASIRARNAMTTKTILPTLFRGNKTTFPSLFQDVLAQIALNLVAAVELQALRYSTVSMEQKKLYAMLNRSTKGKRGLAKVTTIYELEPALVHQIKSVTDGAGEDNQMRVFPLTDHPEVIVAVCEATRDVADDTAALDTTIIVVRRVPGATWMYDVELLQSLLPLINDLIRQVNMRIEGIVARRVALQQIEQWSVALDDRPSHDAVQELHSVIRDGVELVAKALSLRDHCDTYIGERQIGDERLVFTYASSKSLMNSVSIDLTKQENQALVCIQCLEQQREFIVYLLDNKNEKALRPLSGKKVLRLYLTVPMGDHRILCADSLGMEVFDAKTRKLEDDVLGFLRDGARNLEHTIMSTRCRYSYDQLMRLTTQEHANFRLYFATLLETIRRDFVFLHSQQVVLLANDFTGDYKVETWHHAATRRPMTTMPEHFCSINDCEKQLIERGIHFERHVRLPMTNLPRTLDQSRSTLEPAEGIEKRGVYTCSCFASMLDRDSLVPKYALCVFSHDLKSKTRLATTSFTRTQQQYFMTFAAVASCVWTHVFRSCVLHSFGIELFCYLRERLNMKEGIVTSVKSETKHAIVMVSTQPAKYPEGKVLIGKLADKILQFYELKTPISVVFARKLVAAPPASGSSPAQTAAHSSHTQATNRKEQTEKSSFFKRPNFLNRKKATGETGGTQSSPVAGGHESSTTTAQRERIVAHVLIRALDFCGRADIIAFDLETGSLEAAKAIEQRVRDYVGEARSTADAFLNRTPRGDEEINGGGFGRDGGGGGFYYFSTLAATQTKFRDLAPQMNADIRAYVVAMDVETRNPLATQRNEEGRKAVETQELVFSNVALSSALTVVMCASMLLCGLRKEIVLRCTKHELLMLFLREHITDKVLRVDPRDSTHWNAMLRARSHLKNHEQELDAAQNHVERDQDKAAPVRELLTLLSVLVSAVKYMKQVESDSQQAQRQLSQYTIVIQCFYRCVRSKAYLRELRREFKAALTIQCAFRQRIARRKLMFKKWCLAAIKIQRAYRRKIMRRKGTRPKRLTDDLLAVSRRYGGLQALAPSVSQDSDDWKAEMSSFSSFGAFIQSKVGIADLKREKSVMHARMLELSRERKHLSEHERIMEEAKDLFELMDTEGTGEQTREGVKELIKRMRVPLEQEEADDVIAMMDSDHSGEISLREFTNWFFHEYPLLKKRSKECGVISKRDWQWVIEQSAISALRKRWRAVRTGRSLTPLQDEAQNIQGDDGSSQNA